MSKQSFLKGLIIFGILLIIFLTLLNVIIPKSDPLLTKKDFLKANISRLNYIAIGDSLTEGVGDTTNQGGFIPLLAQKLSDQDDKEDTATHVQVKTRNYGISGNTSQQILTRMKQQETIQEDLKKADLLTLTLGGNDVMAVIRKQLTKLTVSSFEKPSLSYQKRLRKIINLARRDNPHLPIYILGIYNPFYLNFPELTQMQEVVDGWNAKTEAVVGSYEGVYFVPINELLYKGIDGQEGIVQTDGQQTRVINDALFSGDHFHPNNIGYQIMADAVMEKISETKADWKH